MALKQYHVGGTYYGYDDQTGQLVAFDDLNHLKQFFPNGIDKTAAPLPSNVSPDKANAAPDTLVSPFGSSAPASVAKTPETPKINTPSPAATGNKPTNLTQAPTGVKFIDSEAYKNLTDEQKQVINSIYNVYSTGTEQQAHLLADSITKAQANADPYYKGLLDLTQGEIGAHVAQVNGDYNTQANIIGQTQKNLLENVKAQSDYLTIEQQTDLAKIAQTYNNDVLNAKNQGANTGTTFGTGYGTADYNLGQLAKSNENLVMSTNANYNYQQQSLQLKASQGDKNAQLQLASLQNTKTNSLNTLGNSAESEVGSSNVNVPGYSPVGGVIGNIQKNKQTDILAGIKNYFSLNQPNL